MVIMHFNVEGMYCYECSQALRRFLGTMKGITGVNAEGGKVSVQFNDSEITPAEVEKVVKETINRLGYKILD